MDNKMDVYCMRWLLFLSCLLLLSSQPKAGSQTDKIVLTGTMTITNAQALVWTVFINTNTTVASSTGTLAFDSSWNLYVSTGSTAVRQWVKIGSQ
jgi:hypothetical protein